MNDDFPGDEELIIKSVEDWKNYIKDSDSAILDEYDEEMSFDEFFEMIEELQKVNNPDDFTTDVNVGGYRFYFDDFG